MDFNKKMKVRLYIAVSQIILGLGLIAMSFVVRGDFISSLGVVFFVIGIARYRLCKRIFKDENSFKKRYIAETDERNVMLWTKARSLAFSAYIYLSAIAIIILSFFDMQMVVDILSISLFSFIVIYWLCYLYISRKH